MDGYLNEFQMKMINIVKILIIILSIGLVADGIWLLTLVKAPKDSAMFFPIIWGGSWILNVYRFNKELKLNGGKITWFRVKCHFAVIGRAFFFSATYLMIVTNYVWQAVHMFLWVVSFTAYLCLLYYLEGLKKKTK